MEGSPSQESTRFKRSTSKKYDSPDAEERLSVGSSQLPEDIASQIEREFLLEVEHAEELAKVIEPGMTLSLDLSYSVHINLCKIYCLF